MDRAVPILPTDDLDVARRFYVDGLGFSVTFDASEDGHTGLLGVERGGIALTLDCPMDGHGRHAAVAIEVSDVRRVLRRVVGAGAGEACAPRRAMGARTFDLHDPSGNTLFVIGPMRREP